MSGYLIYLLHVIMGQNTESPLKCFFQISLDEDSPDIKLPCFFVKDGSIKKSNVKLCHVVVYVKYWFTFFGRKLVHEISENNWCEQKMKFNNKNPFF